MAAKLKKEITTLSSAKNDLETFTKDKENKNSIKALGRLEYICKFPDPNDHENTTLVKQQRSASHLMRELWNF